MDETQERLALEGARLMAKLHSTYFLALREQGLDGVTALAVTQTFIASSGKQAPGSAAPSRPKEL